MIILYKALLGAALLVGLHYLTRTPNYVLAHLALSCPLLSIFAHYFIRVERDAAGLKQTLAFGRRRMRQMLHHLGGDRRILQGNRIFPDDQCHGDS